MHRQGPVKPLERLEDAVTEMLDGVTADLRSKSLKCLHSQAVVRSLREVIGMGRRAQVQIKREIDAKPLSIASFMLENPDMRPEAKIVDPDDIMGVRRGHTVRSL